eukprot:1395534-Pleurochrysis_carterae.AAC.1
MSSASLNSLFFTPFIHCSFWLLEQRTDWTGMLSTAFPVLAVLRLVLLQSHARRYHTVLQRRDERDEAARVAWVEYYVQMRMYDEAYELGWEGPSKDRRKLWKQHTPERSSSSKQHAKSATVQQQKHARDEAERRGSGGSRSKPQPPVGAERADASAVRIQSAVRGRNARVAYFDAREEEARLQWIEYYVSRGELDNARELGWQEDEHTHAHGYRQADAQGLGHAHELEQGNGGGYGHGLVSIEDRVDGRGGGDDAQHEAAARMQALQRGKLARRRTSSLRGGRAVGGTDASGGFGSR